MAEQALPGGQARHRHRGRDVMVQLLGLVCEVARLHGHVLGQRPVAVPIRQPEHLVTHGEPGRAPTEVDDHSGHLVTWHRRSAVVASTIDPGRRPVDLSRRVARAVHPYEDVAGAGAGDGHSGKGQARGAPAGMETQRSHGGRHFHGLLRARVHGGSLRHPPPQPMPSDFAFMRNQRHPERHGSPGRLSHAYPVSSQRSESHTGIQAQPAASAPSRPQRG